MTDRPNPIYLQLVDEDGNELRRGDEITWCRDRINDTDVEYVLAENVAILRTAFETARKTGAPLRLTPLIWEALEGLGIGVK